MSPIEAHERTVGQVFSDAYAFEIPPYQRPYAWEEDQTRELLEDLLDAMDNGETSGGVYFLGSIVLIKSPNDPQSKVIDGQQRLTTLTMILSVLRDLTSDTERRIERGRYVYQKADPDLGAHARCRLLLRHQDQVFFQKYIQNPGATNDLPLPYNLLESQQRITHNAQYIRRKLEALEEDRRNDLVAFLLQRCYIVVVAVPTASSARRIFTVLNARGLDLAPTDILKADLLERSGSVREIELANRWEAVELALGREEMVELFGHIRMIYERDKPRLALEVGFPKFVTPFTEIAEKFISDILEPLGDAALLLTEKDLLLKQFGPEVVRAIRSLERVDNKDWIPPALLRLWKGTANDSPEIASFFLRLERLAYFLFVCRFGVNDRIARFASVMNEIDPLHDRAIAAGGIELTDAEQALFLETLDAPLYTKSRVCKPVLQRLDEALSSGGATYDDIISIEHVLPQTVAEGSEWARMFPDSDERAYWTHRISNLVFLTRRINTRASNWDFERKKREYFASNEGTSPFPLTQGVLQADTWSNKQLEERQSKFIAKLGQVWRLKPDGDSPVATPADVHDEGQNYRSGKELNEKWAIGAEHALYRKDGRWYHRLERFPGALCDENGYVLFKTELDLQTCPGLTIGKQKDHLHVPSGIAALPGYKRVR